MMALISMVAIGHRNPELEGREADDMEVDAEAGGSCASAPSLPAGPVASRCGRAAPHVIAPLSTLASSLTTQLLDEVVVDDGIHGGPHGTHWPPLAIIAQPLSHVLATQEPVISICAATGSGKSKWLPAFLASGATRRVTMLACPPSMGRRAGIRVVFGSMAGQRMDSYSSSALAWRLSKLRRLPDMRVPVAALPFSMASRLYRSTKFTWQLKTQCSRGFFTSPSPGHGPIRQR